MSAALKAGGRLLVILIAVWIVSACQKETVDRADNRQLTGELTIRLLPPSWQSGFATSNHPIQQKIDQFIELHPGVSVKVEQVDSAANPTEHWSFDERHAVISDDGTPDIIELRPYQAGLFMENKLEDLSPYVASGTYAAWQDDYRRLLDAAHVDGKRYLVPVRAYGSMIYYKPALFEELGIADPRQGWTWTDFLDAAQLLKGAGHPVLFEYRNWHEWAEFFVRGLGGTISPDGMSFGDYLDSPATKAAFSALLATDLLGDWGGDPDFMCEPCGMGISALGGPMQESIRERFYKMEGLALAPFPSFEGVPYEVPMTLSGLAISRDSQHKEVAWELIKYIVGETDGEAVDFVAHYTIYADRFTVHELYREPGYGEQMMVERLKEDIPYAAPASLSFASDSDPGGMSIYWLYNYHGYQLYERLSMANSRVRVLPRELPWEPEDVIEAFVDQVQELAEMLDAEIHSARQR